MFFNTQRKITFRQNFRKHRDGEGAPPELSHRPKVGHRLSPQAGHRHPTSRFHSRSRTHNLHCGMSCRTRTESICALDLSRSRSSQSEPEMHQIRNIFCKAFVTFLPRDFRPLVSYFEVMERSFPLTPSFVHLRDDLDMGGIDLSPSEDYRWKIKGWFINNGEDFKLDPHL